MKTRIFRRSASSEKDKWRASHLAVVHMGVVSVVVFATLASTFLVQSHATSPTVSIELENSAVAPPGRVVADGTASGSGAVKFQSTSSSGDSCASYPALPASKPTAANTGVPAGTTLTSSGTINATTAGMVIDAKNVTGGINVNANNVTIQNSKVNVTGYFGINIADGVTGTKVLHSEIYTTTGGYEGIIGSSAFVCGNYVHNFENGMTLGGDIMVQDNFIEKLQSSETGPHYDGIEIYSGSHNKLWGNNILVTDKDGNWLNETGAINVTSTWSVIDDTEINGNWLGGGSYTLNLDDTQGYAVTNLKVTNNVFYGSAPDGYATYGPARESSLASVWSGNTWSDTGQVVGQ